MDIEPSNETDQFTALADQLLLLAEELFGPQANTDWTFVGVEINDRSPHLAYYPEQGSVAISLSHKVRGDSLQLIFQLAHEVAHLLYPTANRPEGSVPPTTILNEGVSTYFSLVVVERLLGEDAHAKVLQSLRESSPGYFNALTLVSRLLQVDSFAVKKLRAIQPLLNDVDAEDFTRAGLNVQAGLFIALTQNFDSAM